MALAVVVRFATEVIPSSADEPGLSCYDDTGFMIPTQRFGRERGRCTRAYNPTLNGQLTVC